MEVQEYRGDVAFPLDCICEWPGCSRQDECHGLPNGRIAGFLSFKTRRHCHLVALETTNQWHHAKSSVPFPMRTFPPCCRHQPRTQVPSCLLRSHWLARASRGRHWGFVACARWRCVSPPLQYTPLAYIPCVAPEHTHKLKNCCCVAVLSDFITLGPWTKLREKSAVVVPIPFNRTGAGGGSCL